MCDRQKINLHKKPILKYPWEMGARAVIRLIARCLLANGNARKEVDVLCDRYLGDISATFCILNSCFGW